MVNSRLIAQSQAAEIPGEFAVIRLLPSVLCPLSSVLCPLSSVLCRLSSAILRSLRGGGAARGPRSRSRPGSDPGAAEGGVIRSLGGRGQHRGGARLVVEAEVAVIDLQRQSRHGRAVEPA